MFIPGDPRSVDPLKSPLVPSSQGLFLEFHNEDSDTAEDKRALNSGIYSIFPGLDAAGEIDVIGLRSDSDSPTASLENVDTSIIEDGFVCDIFRINGFSWVASGEG